MCRFSLNLRHGCHRMPALCPARPICRRGRRRKALFRAALFRSDCALPGQSCPGLPASYRVTLEPEQGTTPCSLLPIALPAPCRQRGLSVCLWQIPHGIRLSLCSVTRSIWTSSSGQKAVLARGLHSIGTMVRLFGQCLVVCCIVGKIGNAYAAGNEEAELIALGSKVCAHGPG